APLQGAPGAGCGHLRQRPARLVAGVGTVAGRPEGNLGQHRRPCAGRRRRLFREGRAPRHPAAWRLPCGQHPLDARWSALRRPRRRAHGSGGAGPVDAAGGRPGHREELALIEPLRTLRLLHYSYWLARRWEDPAFPAAFPWFGTQRYWQDRILELREQTSAMEEPPLSV